MIRRGEGGGCGVGRALIVQKDWGLKTFTATVGARAVDVGLGGP